ncbi:MAG: zinc ribbon domain-containing protein, partial [Ruminococcus sp.]|nr:zinc ribbon domain-containing protein [Ruminococcus sp.]
MYNCVKCGKKLVDGARFCSYCGVRQSKNPICSKCGTELPVDALFCHMCGENVRRAVRPAAVKTASPQLDEAKLTNVTRASVCTSKKGFYSGDENYNLFRIKYFPYMGSLYRAEKYDDYYKIMAVSEEQGTEITAAEISTGTLNNVRIAAVNATGIYVIAVLKENEWFKTVIHRLGHNGDMIKSIALDTAENNNLRDMDICGTKIFYRTTSDDYFNVVYVYDAETDERTLAYKSDGQRKILNIVGADNEVYIKVAFTGSFEGEEYTDSGWYVYNIS